jgi:hypothetical protein
MQFAFSMDKPVLKIEGYDAPRHGKTIQQGYMHLFAGLMMGVRNPSAHEHFELDSLTATHLLFLVSHLMYTLDRATGIVESVPSFGDEVR